MSGNVLNQIAVQTDHGNIGTVIPQNPVDPPKLPKNGSMQSLMIEWTNPSTAQDYLIEINGIKSIDCQVRPTLYQPPGQNGQDNPALLAEVERLKKEIRLLKDQKVTLERDLDNERQRPRIFSVEVWTYDKSGAMADHYILDVEDVESEIPIGNVVVQLKKKEP